MKVKKINIIFMILIIMAIICTPVFSKASNETIKIAVHSFDRTLLEDGGGGGGSPTDTSPFFSTGTGNDPTKNPDYYDPGSVNTQDTNAVSRKLGPIFNIITTAGIATGVIVLIILGIKYVIGSVDEKAEYKKSMMPYLIGAILLISITTILKLFSGIIGDFLSRL